MRKIVVCLDHRVKLQLRRLRRETADKGLSMRCQIVLLANKGRARPVIAEGVGCSVSWVNRVVARFDDWGIAGLMDRREDNGQEKVDEQYLSTLYEVVDGSPQDYGYPRPTWTRELLTKVMRQLIGTQIHPTTMSRALKRIGARLDVHANVTRNHRCQNMNELMCKAVNYLTGRNRRASPSLEKAA